MAATKWVRSKFLGEGTYGSVFWAECVSTRTVAVKSSLESFSWSLRLERAVLYELRGCKEIVGCFENEDFNSIEYGKKFYNIVLEYAHVHDRGFVHYDMKPDKVLVFNVPSGECKGVVKYNLKLADFGLAKQSGGISCVAGREYRNRGTLLNNIIA